MKSISFLAGLVLIIFATCVVICAKGKEPVPTCKVSVCWLLQTIGLLLVFGFLAMKKKGIIIIAFEIALFVVAMVLTLFSRKLFDFTKEHAIMNNLKGLMIMVGLGLTTAMIACFALGSTSMKEKLILCLVLAVMVWYLIKDTSLIVQAKYQVDMTKEDYIYGSMKFYADIFLIFELYAKWCD